MVKKYLYNKKTPVLMFEEDESGQIILVEGVGHDDLLPICLRTDKDEFGVLMRLYYKKLLNIIKDVKKRYLPQTVVFAVPEQTKAKKLFSL